MGLTISTEKSRFVLKLPEKYSEEMFNKIVMSILKEEATNKECVVPMNQMQEIMSRNLPHAINPVFKTGGVVVEKKEGYSGFLYIKCKNCGKVRGFNSKIKIDKYICSECGEATEFIDDLKPLRVRCECGEKFNYFTNMADEMFDIPCLGCGTPVAVKHNDKKDMYETIH